MWSWCGSTDRHYGTAHKYIQKSAPGNWKVTNLQMTQQTLSKLVQGAIGNQNFVGIKVWFVSSTERRSVGRRDDIIELRELARIRPTLYPMTIESTAESSPMLIEPLYGGQSISVSSDVRVKSQTWYWESDPISCPSRHCRTQSKHFAFGYSTQRSSCWCSCNPRSHLGNSRVAWKDCKWHLIPSCCVSSSKHWIFSVFAQIAANKTIVQARSDWYNHCRCHFLNCREPLVHKKCKSCSHKQTDRSRNPSQFLCIADNKRELWRIIKLRENREGQKLC